MEWNDISVFISSTFNDMHAERDYIMKNVFPQLGEYCERRRIFLRDIDLRWGVTPQDSQTQNTIYKCLTAVDSCRPFFLCFLGQRRGWVPTLEKINQRTRDTFPEIVEMARTQSRSATEYEIEHALLMPLAYIENGLEKRNEPVKNAVFLRRRPDYLRALTPSQKKIFLDYRQDRCGTPQDYAAYLRECREANERTYARIARKNLILDYDCRWDSGVTSPELKTDDPDDDRAQGRLRDFSVRAGDIPAALRRQLLDILKKEFPDELPQDDRWPLKAYLLASFALQFRPYAQQPAPKEDLYACDAEQQSIFRSACLRDAVRRPDARRSIAAYCDGPSDKPLLILAEAGMGKTTLLAEFLQEYRGARVLPRFLGVSELSSALLPLWDSILHEVGLPSPPDLDTLRAGLPALLATMAPCVLLFDGLEQIPGGTALLDMLPAPLPEGIKVILSVRDVPGNETISRYLAFHADYPLLRLRPFTVEQKKELIRGVLRSSLKELSPELTETVCSLNESGNPLYLSILLSDIRSFGSSSRLQGEIRRHGSTPFSAFDAMLARMEADRFFDMLPPERCVPLVFGLLAQARDGLSYGELTDCLAAFFPEAGRELCAGSLQICLRQVRPFLSRRDGRTDFRHQAFRAAAQARYQKRAGELHAALARLFGRACDPEGDGSFSLRDQRALREYAWQLSFVSEGEHRALYTNVCYLNARCEGQRVRELIREFDSPALAALGDWKALLIRFRDGLEHYPDLLPSLLWFYGSPAQRETADFSRLHAPWLCAEKGAEAAEETGAAEARGLRVLGEQRLHAAAFCFAEGKPLAFAFTGQGQITAWAPESLLPLANPLYTAKAMPLGLCAGERVLASAFDNEKIELYAFEADDTALRSRPLRSLRYLPPLYSGAAMVFDDRGRLWYQPEEEQIACCEPESGETRRFGLPGCEELSSLCAAGGTIYGTACAGRGTLLFSLNGQGALHTRDLGEGDSRVLCAGEKGCLVTCAASGGAYPLLLVNDTLETCRESRPDSPITAALPIGRGFLLLPAKQTLGQLWLWDGEKSTSVEQQLLYQDQAAFFSLPDGSIAMLSAGAITRFSFASGGKGSAAPRPAGADARPEGLPDLSRYELQQTKCFARGDYACVTGVSVSMRSVRDEKAAGAVFLKKTLGRWRVLGDGTWPRSLELIRAVCIDPERGRFTLLFRSEDSVHHVLAVQGTAEELCAGRDFRRELLLPQNKENFGCFATGRLFVSAGELLQVYDARTLRYETALLLPAPITSITPEGARVNIQYGSQTMSVAIQEGAT